MQSALRQIENGAKPGASSAGGDGSSESSSKFDIPNAKKPLTLDSTPAQEKLPRNPKELQEKLDKILANFPLDKSKESVKLRKNLFSKMDYNGNCYLSITEIENGWKYFGDIPEIMNRDSVINRAFN
jgi:hypothetical protein